MGKRIFAMLLCVALLILCVPQATAAEQSEEAQRVERRCANIAYRIYASADKESLKGWCGYYTGMQLWMLGITKYVESYNGKDYYDVFAKLDYTTGGYKCRPYSAGTYTLEEALLTVTNGGSQNAYNLLVGFQRTSTEAGQQYGHAMVIHGIIDGIVYFSENYYTGFGGGEGSVSKCTIAQFADYFDDWTQFEGLIHFGQKNAADFTTQYPADLFVSCMGGLLLRQPDPEAEILREVGSNEVLRVNRICRTDDNIFYYQTTEGFVEATACRVERVNTEDVTVEAELPETMESNKKFTFQGVITAVDSALSAVQINVVKNGVNVQTASTAVSGHADRFRMEVQGLEAGVYQLQVLAMVENYTVVDGAAVSRRQMVKLWEKTIGVDTDVPAAAPESAPLADGWHYIDGTRYFYQNGAPRVGWYCDKGTDYYFKEDGSVTTGWTQINGKWRCFTDTGVMRTGWVDTSWGTFYLLSNGVPAVGQRTIDGVSYQFSEQGILMNN